ncbi:MAG TPA: hypothetical protein VE978_11800 [Chitinophagales bacterium]|nr:hypothetical protein [Chitinophagales bacterium]
MGLLDFFKRNKSTGTDRKLKQSTETIDRSQWTGNDFEFLIAGDIDITMDNYNHVMTPDSFDWTKIIKNDWTYYQVGEDEFSHSLEPPGIQMTFNKEIAFDKAKKIADEVVEKINSTGQKAELVILDKTKVYKF